MRVVASVVFLVALTVPQMPAASATPLFPGFDATCQSRGFDCAAGDYSDASSGWWDKWYYARIHNCTRYAAYRLAQNGLADPGRSWGPASSWGAKAPGTSDNTPAVGAIAWWAAGTTVGGTTGHVAYVEEVGDGYFVETEDNADPINVTRRVTVSANTVSWPTAFLHIKDAGGQPAASAPSQGSPQASAQTATGVYTGTIGAGSTRVPATLTLTKSDPITGSIDLPGICSATWSESQRVSDTTRIVEAHVTSGTDRCVDNQWSVTLGPGQINGTDTSRPSYSVSLSRQ